MKLTEIIQEVMVSAQRKVNSYTYPVFISGENNRPDLIASSVVISVGEKFYLVTASHVLKYVLDVGSQFLIGVNCKYIYVEKEFVYSSHTTKDNFDIAFAELEGDFIHQHGITALEEGNLFINKSFSSIHISFVHGFPNSRNKQAKAFINTKAFKVKSYAFSGVIKQDFEGWEKYEKNESIHTCMTYGKTKAMNTPVFPRGISGGGLWVVPHVDRPDEIYLESILIEYYEKDKIVFATKISHVFEFILKYS